MQWLFGGRNGALHGDCCFGCSFDLARLDLFALFDLVCYWLHADCNVRVQHLFKREPQSAYWMQIQSGMYVLVASFHVEDCENISAEEKAKLIKMFDDNALPHIVTETHVVICSQTSHATWVCNGATFSPGDIHQMPKEEHAKHCEVFLPLRWVSLPVQGPAPLWIHKFI